MCKVRLKVANVLDSLIAAGRPNSFQMVGAEKMKKRLLNLVVQEGIHKRFWLAGIVVAIHNYCGSGCASR